MPDKLRHDRAGPGPRLDRILAARLELLLDLAIHLEIDIRSFFERPTHNRPLFPWLHLHKLYFKRS